MPRNSTESMQLAGMLALCRSLVAAADKRTADVDAALDYAGELAERTGEGNAYWMGFGPTSIVVVELAVVLAVSVVGLDPQPLSATHPNFRRTTKGTP